MLPPLKIPVSADMIGDVQVSRHIVLTLQYAPQFRNRHFSQNHNRDIFRPAAPSACPGKLSPQLKLRKWNKI